MVKLITNSRWYSSSEARVRKKRRFFDTDSTIPQNPPKKRRKKKQTKGKTTIGTTESTKTVQETNGAVTDEKNIREQPDSTSNQLPSSSILVSSSISTESTSTTKIVDDFKASLANSLIRELSTRMDTFQVSIPVMPPNIFDKIVSIRRKPRSTRKSYTILTRKLVFPGEAYVYENQDLINLFSKPGWNIVNFRSVEDDRIQLEIKKLKFNYFRTISLLLVSGTVNKSFTKPPSTEAHE